MRLRLGALAAVVVSLVAAPRAGAHPLGNFSVNHLVEVRVTGERVALRYLLDQAEIPTFQERGLSDAQVLARKRAEVSRHLAVVVDGRVVRPRLATEGRISHPDGQGGLALTRVELALGAPVSRPHRVVVHDQTFSDRVGWKAIVARPGAGTAVRSTAPSADPTNGLRSYPSAATSSPVERRSATLWVRPGDGTLAAPHREGGPPASTALPGDGFTSLFADAAAGRGVLVLLLASLAWGMLHALSPGHGKAMVAAYLAGSRGTARHALGLGATVTVTHTIGVFALGAVTLALAQYVLPERLYPWLTLVSGLMVVGVGAAIMRSRVRWYRARRAGRRHEHGGGHHADHHHHHAPGRLGWRGVVGMGASAGLIPCPSALVVLLAAVSQHQVALGLLLIVAFSVGLAFTLTALGMTVLLAGRFSSRLSFSSRPAALLPLASAIVIVAAGGVVAVRAIPQVL